MEAATPRVDPVTYRGGHLQIVACAGAGKTEKIAERVASLLAEGVDPAGIIAFTFTEKAGSELKSRIELKVTEHEDLGPEMLGRLGPLFIGTMHAYSMLLLQTHVPGLAAFDVLDNHKLVGILSREYDNIGIGRCFGRRRSDSIEIYLRSIDVLENELIDPESLPDGPFKDSYRRYLDVLDSYQMLTFGQMIARAVGALRADDAVREQVIAPLRHVIVDEYQDTNPAQEALIQELCAHGRGAHVTVVGDDDQAIYQWRGATVRNILDFGSRYPDVATAELALNHRSQPPIVAASRTFIEVEVSERLRKSLDGSRELRGGLVVRWEAETASHEAENLARTILGLHARGFAWQDMAILLRSVKVSAKPIVTALENHGIPIRSSGASGLFIEADAQLLASTYAWLADRPWKRDRWDDDYVPVDLDMLLAGYAQSFDLSDPETAGLGLALERWYDVAHDQGTDASLVGDYYQLLSVLGVAAWPVAPGTANAARMGTLARFSSLLADFEHATKRARKTPGSGSIRGGLHGGPWLYDKLYNYMQHYALSTYEGFAGEETLTADAVEVTTVHAAKGLQWPVVFVPALTDARFPSSMTGKDREYLVPGDLFDKARYLGSFADEARLFYVAMTRARDGLYLSRFRRNPKRQSPSRFLAALGEPGSVAEGDLPLVQPAGDRRPGVGEKPVVSFSDLAAYSTCPQAYRLRKLVGFVPPLAKELGYGKAVHQVLRTVADVTKSQGAVPDAATVDRIVEDAFFLPFADPALYERLLRSAKRLVAGFVEEHTSELGHVWQTERPFELHLENATIAGRADVVIDGHDGEAGSMAILDYKTSVADWSETHDHQLRTYADAGRREGMDIAAAYLMDLQHGTSRSVGLSSSEIGETERWLEGVVDSLAAGEFDPVQSAACAMCDVARVCALGGQDGVRGD